MTTYDTDAYIAALTERLRKLELSVARNKPASGVSVEDSGGFFGGPGGLTLEEILAAIGAGTSPGSFLTVIRGGQGDVQSLGSLGATELIDLANANLFIGTLDANCTIGFTGWTNGKDCQITLILYEDGTGGWTPTFTGVTWDGGEPAHDTTASTFTRYVFTSSDGGTTIIGAQTGGRGTYGPPVAHGTLGATETFSNPYNENYHWGTLNTNLTPTFTTLADGEVHGFTLELIEDGTGGWTVTWPGSVTWLGGSTPAHTTTAGTTTIYAFFTRNGGTTWIGGQLGAGAASFATPAIVLGTAAAAGAAATVIRSDATIVAFDATVPANVTATAATGAAAVAARRDHVHALEDTAGHYELLMAAGITSPPEPLENGAGDDWLYAWVPG